jgi:hypothetical protein
VALLAQMNNAVVARKKRIFKKNQITHVCERIQVDITVLI